jgi:hypothetical protein
MGEPRTCDFCADLPAEYRYRVKEVVTYEGFDYVHQSADWFACSPCSKMIEEENMRGVVDRAVNAHYARMDPIIPPRSRAMITAHCYQLYIEFLKRRKGKREIYDYRKE